MKAVIYVFSLLIVGFSSLKAQSIDTTPGRRPPPNMGNAIQKFKSSDFMVRFSDFKNQMETDARDFIAHQNAYSAADVSRVRTAYGKTAAKFNQVMIKIKDDFKDKELIKMINKRPDIYSDGLKGKIEDLEESYKANFQQTLADVTEKDGSAAFLILVDLIKAVGELSQYFRAMKYEKEYMNDQYIEQNLIIPYKVPSWSELATTVTIRTDVKEHPSRVGGGNTKKDKSNDGTNGDGGGTKNDDNNGGTTDNNNDNGAQRGHKPTSERYTEKGNVVPAPNKGFGVEGEPVIKPSDNSKDLKKKPINTEGAKKTVKPNNQ